MPICKICLKEKKLIKAHIYPEWVYRAIYPNGKVEGLSLLIVSSSNPKTRKARIGLYDNKILCGDCDNFLGLFDSIGKQALMTDHLLHLFKDLEDMGKVYTINDIDPIRLKNFFLSLLFRACLSEREEYKNVDLPNKFTNRLKEIVTNNLETSLDEFSIMVTKFRTRNPKNAFEKYTQVPYKNRIDGINFFTLNLPNGYKVIIKADQRPMVSALVPFAMRSNYPIYVMEHEYFEESTEFDWLKTYISSRN